MTLLVALFLVGVTLSNVQADESSVTPFPGEENAWMEPSPGDSRGPCPFINTLANHGIINRSGREVDLFEMVDELSANFDYAPPLFLRLANAATGFNFTYAGTNGTVLIDLDSLYEHNKLEHDASFVRPDEYFGFSESRSIDQQLVDDLIARNPNSTVLTKADIMAHQTERILHSRINNPDYFFSEGQATAFSAQATFLLGMGQDPLLETVEKARLQEFLTFERFPEGYVPQTGLDPDFVPLNVVMEGTLGYDTRLEFAMNFLDLISRNLTVGEAVDETDTMNDGGNETDPDTVDNSIDGAVSATQPVLALFAKTAPVLVEVGGLCQV